MMNARIRVKICGITSLDDALMAAQAGADAIGFVFYPNSVRYIAPYAAREIALRLPPFITRVGLFVDAGRERVTEIINSVPLDLLQFHGNEDPSECSAFDRPYIKAVPMQTPLDVLAYTQRYTDAVGVLLDSHGGGKVGGTGETFDWNTIPAQLAQPLILAGGLKPGNVAQAIAHVRPWAVDVSSGVESAPGHKDPALIRSFINEVRRVEFT